MIVPSSAVAGLGYAQLVISAADAWGRICRSQPEPGNCCSSTVVAKYLTFRQGFGQIIRGVFRPALTVIKPQVHHQFAESGMMTAAWINNYDIALPVGMLIEKSGEQFGMATLVE
ncbi:hypothetical protein ACFL4I_01025, partial [Pseudomonadota bacterium]